MARPGLVQKRVVAKKADGSTYNTTVWVREQEATQISDKGTSFSVVPSAISSKAQRVADTLPGEALSTQSLSTGMVQMRRLHDGRGPVATFVSDSGQVAHLGSAIDLFDKDAAADRGQWTMGADEAKAYNERFGFATPGDLEEAVDRDVDELYLSELCTNERGQIGVQTELITGHLTCWPVSVDDFARKAVADEDGNYDYDTTSEYPSSFRDDDQDEWEPAALLAEYVKTDEGKAYIAGKARHLSDEIMKRDERYTRPPFLTE